MLEFLINYGLFLLKAVTLLGLILIGIAGILLLVGRTKPESQPQGQIEITPLSDTLDDYKTILLQETLSDDDYKKHLKTEKKAEKQKEKEEKKKQKKSLKKALKFKKKSDENTENEPDSRLFVLKFEGDLEASEVSNLRECITALLTIATPNDQVLVCLESAGGYVHSYGLAASQLERLRTAEIPLTVAVDSMAASGGYMMACVANTLIASPFAVIGSIGVMAELPNFHRLLEKHGVDYELHTAGKYKRTLTVFAENTEPLRKKFVQELHEVHDLFKDHIKHYRGDKCEVDKIATGEHWHGTQALDLGLIDECQTSDDFILHFHQNETGKIFQLDYVIPESWIDKLQGRIGIGLSRLVGQLWKSHYPKAQG